MIEKNNSAARESIKLLPHKPGIYQFLNDIDEVIYVGKAKDLRKRVSSYFTKNHDTRKTTILVRNIRKIRHMVVESEQDALLLENNLIKKYQPRYNIRLKDDKSYPWICIKNEPFPRVFKTRELIRDGSKYFGPYTSIYTVRTLLELFKKQYKLRTCNFQLTPENIQSGKYKICLEYHIGNCEGPCEGRVSAEKYNQGIDDIIHILKGNIQRVTNHLEEQMNRLALDMNFEEAQVLKEKYDSLRRYQSKSTIVSPTITDIDVFTIEDDLKFAYVNYLKVIQGAIIQTYTLEIKKSLDEPVEDLLMAAILDIREKIFSNAKEILVPFLPAIPLKDICFKVPKRGDKRKLLELSQRNAKYYRLEKEKHQVLMNPKVREERILKTIQKDLNLPEYPIRIECFDNSNLQGTNPVASCVVFINGRPKKSDYRHYNIKTVEGPNDFASMEEVVFRRYKRQTEEQQPLPQLIVIDGGKGQLSSAVNALEKLSLRGKISIIGIAKRLEEIYFPDDTVPLYINKNSETLKIIQQLRDEAHRFGITFHRNKRSKTMINTELFNIQGIGIKTAEKLLQRFKSVKHIREVSKDELIEEIGKQRAEIIYNYLHS